MCQPNFRGGEKYRTKGCWRPKFTAMKWLKCCKKQCSRSRAVSERAWTPFCVILWRWLKLLGEFCEKLGEFALAHKYLAERNSLSSLPGTQWAQKNSLSSVFETVLSETVFGAFPMRGGAKSQRQRACVCVSPTDPVIQATNILRTYIPWSSFPWCLGEYQGKPPQTPRNFWSLWTP